MVFDLSKKTIYYGISLPVTTRTIEVSSVNPAKDNSEIGRFWVGEYNNGEMKILFACPSVDKNGQRTAEVDDIMNQKDFSSQALRIQHPDHTAMNIQSDHDFKKMQELYGDLFGK